MSAMICPLCLQASHSGPCSRNVFDNQPNFKGETEPPPLPLNRQGSDPERMRLEIAKARVELLKSVRYLLDETRRLIRDISDDHSKTMAPGGSG